MNFLTPSEPPIVKQVFSNSRLLVVCDHFSSRIPKYFKKLGLCKNDIESHITKDIYIDSLAMEIVKLLNSNAIFAQYSRLVVDLNRSPEDDTIITKNSDGVKIVGNIGITVLEKNQRLEQFFYPYHQKIENHLKRIKKMGKNPIILSLHSFVKKLNKEKAVKPWSIGTMWDSDNRLSDRFKNYCLKFNNITFGDNLPYSGRDLADYTIDLHAEGKYPYLCLEIRQDIIATKQKRKFIVKLIVDFFTNIFKERVI